MIRPRWAGKGWLSTPVPATVWQYALWEDKAMPTRSFDVVILGGGNAGLGVTVAALEAGLEVAMLEPDPARWHLPEPRLPTEKSAGRSRTSVRPDRARQSAPRRGRK